MFTIKPKETCCIKMGEMKPMQVGVVVSSNEGLDGTYVMRTQSSSKFEVMNLSVSQIDRCWTNDKCDFLVRLLSPVEKLTLEIFNSK